MGIENLILHFETQVSEFLKASQSLPLPLLVLLSFGGGLAASLTPCVLSMLPLNLSYIGTANITSKTDAFKKVSLFILGSAIVFSILGVFASFASVVLIEYRGYVHLIIGLIIFIMSLSMLEIIKLPLPQFITQMPNGGPFIIGMAFALVSSPCASPILFAILAMASASGSVIGSTLIMVAYSFGYTGVIFLTSLFAGFAKQLDFFKRHNKIITVVSTIILALIGGFYLYSGAMWFIG